VILGSGAQADNTWLKDPAFEGTYVYQADFPWVASSTPAQQDFQNALKQYAPGELTSVTFNPNDSQVWAALEVFKAAIERAKPTSFTASTVLSSIYALPASFSIPGITPPLTYAKNAPNPNIDCYFLVQIKSGKWMVPGSGNPICPGSS
jgi:hypothetical protein